MEKNLDFTTKNVATDIYHELRKYLFFTDITATGYFTFYSNNTISLFSIIIVSSSCFTITDLFSVYFGMDRVK